MGFKEKVGDWWDSWEWYEVDWRLAAKLLIIIICLMMLVAILSCSSTKPVNRTTYDNTNFDKPAQSVKY